MEFKFCESDFYFLNGSKNCMVATYNFGSVYICQYKPKGVQLWRFCWLIRMFSGRGGSRKYHIECEEGVEEVQA